MYFQNYIRGWENMSQVAVFIPWLAGALIVSAVLLLAQGAEKLAEIVREKVSRRSVHYGKRFYVY